MELTIFTDILTSIRSEVLKTKGRTQGQCILASDLISAELKKQNIPHRIVEGWCRYNKNLDSCSDRPFDEHTWVEVQGGTVLDVTMDQFSSFLKEETPGVYIGPCPEFLTEDRPGSW